ncbi:Clavaminate synthase-like protein [Multifurca ochricompacta]|uniref:Clavaminate synthase-like protein n=1 Tax=Multifurca ochricompacta TaxID=376703 RepID=A0AAD4QQG5_9AGAM|nr:Clavaminate synthase-like protein [Multifurca ochricompacta]
MLSTRTRTYLILIPRYATRRTIVNLANNSYQLKTAVNVSYNSLVSPPSSLSHSIEQAFGSRSDSLGIIIVRDLPPEYAKLRERLLKLAHAFAQLDEPTREKYADAKSRYSFGWSHGKEVMNGRPADTLKGSYYANPVIDAPSVHPGLLEAYPEYYGTNIWPKDERGIEGFKSAFKNLGSFVFDVGVRLAAACQPFASSYLTDSSLSLSNLISSQTTKARLLHYFPPSPESPLPAEDEPIDSWCGFHVDHSLLTGLCSALYIKHIPGGPPEAIPSPSPSSGLYIRTRGGELVKVTIPPDCLAFQTGEALELTTAGRLRATPHCVRVGAGDSAEHVSRETFALFMQPDVNQRISEAETFGEFSKRILDDHYNDVNVQ